MTDTKILPADMIEARDLLRGLARNGLVGGEADRGFHQRSDAIQTVVGTGVTVDGQSLNEIWADMQARVAAYNRTSNALMAALTFPVVRPTEKVGVYTTAKFEQATEFGRPSKVAMSYIARGFPLDHFDLGMGYTQEYLDEAPSNEISALLGVVRASYEAGRFALALEAILTKENRTDKDGVSVKALYNADGEVPPVYKRTTHADTHTHYLTSGIAGNYDLTDLRAMESHLLHHGYGDFGEQFVLFVPRDNMATVRGLTGYISAASSPIPSVREGQIVGRVSSAPAGMNADGFIDRWAVVESLDMPANYLLGIATGGSFATQNPVGMREHRNPSARGLRLIEGPRQNYPLIDSVFDYYAGAGIRHRGSAVAMELTVDATYDTPVL